MYPITEEMLARAKQVGYLTFDEVNAALPEVNDPDELAAFVEWLDTQGINLIDDEDDTEPPTPTPAHPTSASGSEFAEFATGNDPNEGYQRNPAFETLLRTHQVACTDVVCSFDANGRIFDAVLIVHGLRALSEWLLLRDLVSVTGMWPVIQDAVPAAKFTAHPQQLDPGHRWEAWTVEYRKNRDLPMLELTAEMIRADAAANIAAAEKVPPTPWTFYPGRGKAPPSFTEPDSPLEASTPDFAKVFANNGPFRAHRYSFGGPDCPPHAFVTLRLYPTAVPWEVFAYTWGGGWNDCPLPEEQLSIIRHWHGQYGIEPVSHLGDWYEFFVPSPPRSRHQAERLTWEMGNFGEETFYAHGPWCHPDPIEAVRTSHYWYFWWD